MSYTKIYLSNFFKSRLKDEAERQHTKMSPLIKRVLSMYLKNPTAFEAAYHTAANNSDTPRQAS